MSLMCKHVQPPHVFVPGIRGQPLFSGHQLPLPNNLLPKLLWQCKAWRSMLKTKSSNGWSQQWLTTQSTSSRKGAIDSVGPNYCPTGVACAKLLIVWASEPLRCMMLSSVTTTWLCLMPNLDDIPLRQTPPSIHGVPLEFSLKILRQVEFHKGSALNADSLQHLQKIVTGRDD